MDWKKCISALQAAGLSIDQISAEAGVTANAVREVVAGRTKQPRANAALRLVGLCCRHGITPPTVADTRESADA
jgi:lambda repressor-like predicted transcriptional regulator